MEDSASNESNVKLNVQKNLACLTLSTHTYGKIPRLLHGDRDLNIYYHYKLIRTKICIKSTLALFPEVISVVHHHPHINYLLHFFAWRFFQNTNSPVFRFL